MSLQSKIALVTGASRGIGKSIALTLAKAGATVIGTATSEKGAQAISDYLNAENLSGQGMALDVTDPAQIEKTLQAMEEMQGMPSILVNNAGITRDDLMLRMDSEAFDQVIDTNLKAVFEVTRRCLRAMFRARWGRVINIGSVVGSTGNPGQANYCAAKAGLIGMSKALAAEIASRNITVNVVSPGFIDTDMTRELPDAYRDELTKRIPAKRLGQPEDIANAVSFLASDKASYITGTTLHVNGGMFMS